MIKVFLGCMDHSVGEQITNNPNEWHTTTMAVSEGGQISDLCRAIIKCFNGTPTNLIKWSKGHRGNYRNKFSRCVSANLTNYPVMIFSNSSQENQILSNQQLIVEELGLSRIYQSYISERGKARAKIGPVTQISDGADYFFDLPENQVIMLLWIAHFMLRCHRMTYDLLKKALPDLICVDWSFYMDKLAGGDENHKLFNSVVRHNMHQKPVSLGNIRLASFVDSDTVETDLLADNLSGLINNVMQEKLPKAVLQPLIDSGKCYFEHS